MKQMPFLLLLLLAVMPWLTPFAVADERKVTPSIAIKEEYDDNLYFSTSAQPRKGDFISTVSPALELTNNTERVQSGLKMQVNSSYYLDNQSLNNIDQDYSGNFGYALSSQANLLTSAGFLRDSRVDRDFTQTGLVLTGVPRDHYTGQLGGDYAFSEVLGAKLLYSFNGDYYDSPVLSDYQSHDVSLVMSRDLSTLLSRTVGRIKLGATKYNYTSPVANNDSQTTNYTGTIGAERKLDERFSYFADFGYRYTQSKFDTFRLAPTENPFLLFAVPTEGHTDGTGFTGQTGLTYNGEVNNAQLALSHDVDAASGSNGTVERTMLQGSMGRSLNETSNISLSAGYATNKSTQNNQNVASLDESSWWLQPKLLYTLTQQLGVETSYSYALVQYKENNTEAYRNLVMVRLVYQYKMIE